MFKMMRDVADRNERLRKTGGHVLDWMFGNYALAAAMSFRRDLDRDTSALGLLSLLYEIEGRPAIINRARVPRQVESKQRKRAMDVRPRLRLVQANNLSVRP